MMRNGNGGEKSRGGEESFPEKRFESLLADEVVPAGDEEGEKLLKSLVVKFFENPGGEDSELHKKLLMKWIEGDSLFTVKDAYAENHPEKKVNQAHQLEQFMKMAVKLRLDGISGPESEKHLADWLSKEDMMLCRVDKGVWLEPGKD